jgi:hypothetical protein
MRAQGFTTALRNFAGEEVRTEDTEGNGGHGGSWGAADDATT